MCLRVSYKKRYDFFCTGSGSAPNCPRSPTLFRWVRGTRILEDLPNILKGAEQCLKFNRGIVVMMTRLPPSLLHLLSTRRRMTDRDDRSFNPLIVLAMLWDYYLQILRVRNFWIEYADPTIKQRQFNYGFIWRRKKSSSSKKIGSGY